MTRSLRVPGESMVYVRGPAGSVIAGNGNQLGLAVDEISITPQFFKEAVNVNAWGQAPVDMQHMMAQVTISMNLAHFDRPFLDECIRLSMGGGTTVGQTGRAGRLLGNNLAQFAQGNLYIGLSIAAPVEGKPWRFYYCYLADQPVVFPMGVQRSIVNCNWVAIPYTNDPWGGGTAQGGTVAGTGAENAIIWDHASTTW